MNMWILIYTFPDEKGTCLHRCLFCDFGLNKEVNPIIKGNIQNKQPDNADGVDNGVTTYQMKQNIVGSAVATEQEHVVLVGEDVGDIGSDAEEEENAEGSMSDADTDNQSGAETEEQENTAANATVESTSDSTEATNTEAGTSDTGKSVQTGDHTNVILPGILAIVAGIGAFGVEIWCKIKDKKRGK